MLRRDAGAACDSGLYEVQYRDLITDELITISDLCGSEFGQEPSLLERKVLTYREIIELNSCQW